MNRPMKREKNNLCKCGCGTLVSDNYKRGHCNRGRKFGALSESTKQKLRLANLGKCASQETKNRMAKANKQKKEVKWAVDEWGCWNCTSHMVGLKYPRMSRNGRVTSIARFMFEKKFGITSKELFICHKCDNPFCINPDHLFLGTLQENKRDEVNKNRQAKGEKNGNHKLSQEQAMEIFNSKERTSILAKKYCVCKDIIKRIRNGRIWKHISN